MLLPSGDTTPIPVTATCSIGNAFQTARCRRPACVWMLTGGMKGESSVEATMVERGVNVPQSYRLVRRDARPDRTVVRLRTGASFGGDELAICAGPCGVESHEQLHRAAEGVAQAGANVLRGGAYKPRTSPYSFQGLGEEALKMLREAADAFGLGVVTEVLDPRDVEKVASYADMLQIGTRSMQNFPLLREAGDSDMPVLLKRGLSATVQEWLLAAEYIVLRGNDNVVLCERGVRSFDVATRNLLDIAVVPLLEELTHLPVIVDPSHAMGIARLVPPVAIASVAAGAHGLLIEVHPDPPNALSDGAQSLDCAQFDRLMRRLMPVAEFAGRRLPQRADRTDGVVSARGYEA
ncbi:MAG: 3-deoxy-7-phosphoheptulonate synthase [Candidatus Eremiobacteraeota bacterium]|nr:3-deoxy-7-phosphoheptulonate synthase [Candidatus Eremiobacteraeota bacterium]